MAREKNESNAGKPNKKTKSWIRFFLSVIVILGLGYVVFNYVPFIAKYDHFVIISPSMEPTIMVGDVVIIDTSIQAEDLVPGQIMAFYADINEDGIDEVVVHYLNSKYEDTNGVMIYKSNPEVSDTTDPWDLTADDIIGAHVLTIAKIGPLLLFAQSTIGRVILVIDIVVIYLLVEMFSKDKKKKELQPESSEENIEEIK